MSANVLPLFAVPVYVNNIGTEGTDFLKNPDIYERMKSDNGFYTKDRYVLNDPNIENVKDKIIQEIGAYINFLGVTGNVEFYITNSWGVMHKSGDWGPSHYHSNSLFSGIYYFDVYPDSGDLVLENEQENLFSRTLKFDFKDWNIFNSNEWTITPENGMVILFPSHLSHRINVNKNSNNRFCIAFNVFARGMFGNDDSGLADLELL